MKILVAVEDSQYSTKALEYAVGLAKKEGAGLTAVSIAELMVGMVEVFPDASVEEALLKHAAMTAERAKEYASGKGVALKTVIESSASAAESILETAEKLGADLIVLGSRGKKGVERFLLGSVATKVAAHARCSVLIVR